ncbi:hypothetical protein J6590_094233 [Homalodisca vitripennis]|nr:hypothetical protein J6590_094233 [Homalodisca vitripennis]
MLQRMVTSLGGALLNGVVRQLRPMVIGLESSALTASTLAAIPPRCELSRFLQRHIASPRHLLRQRRLGTFHCPHWKDTRNASTETDALFLNTKDELVSKVQKLTGVQSSLVDKIQSLTLELDGVTSLSAADVSSVSCQIEESITPHVPLTPSENLAGVETVMVACQNDEGFPLFISQQELGDSDTSIEACPSAPLPRDDTPAVEAVAETSSDRFVDTPSLSSNLLEMRRNERKQTDDEVWEGLSVIDNEGVLVLIPSVCLTIRFAGSTNPIVEALRDLHNTKAGVPTYGFPARS